MKAKTFQNLLGGLAGAVALNILHETVRRMDKDAPRVDLVGEEGLNKMMEKVGAEPLEGKALYAATMAGDLLSNALYYSTIGMGRDRWLLFRGTTYGVSAGLGALKYTSKMGLNDAPINRNQKTRLMAVGYYLFGGLITACTIRALRRR
jgi:hypothetical protein